MHTMQIKALSAIAGILAAAINRRPPTAGIPSAATKRPTATAGIPSSPIKALSVSAGIPSAPRSAFTLVELLVVIGIIALLAAIVTPAVMRAQATARNAAIKAEIDMLHMAIMSYKNEYGSFPPCADTTTAYASNGPASKHLARLFPRCANPTGTGVNAQFASALPLTPATAIIAWLSGYSTDPALPLTGGARTKLYDYDKSRLDTNQLVYFPSGKPASPYIYVNVSEYANTWPSSAYTYTVGTGGQSYTIAANQYGAEKRTATEYFNPDTFQILCAGRDEIFGNDDDLSNFWPSTRKAFLDSLNQ